MKDSNINLPSKARLVGKIQILYNTTQLTGKYLQTNFVKHHNWLSYNTQNYIKVTSIQVLRENFTHKYLYNIRFFSHHLILNIVRQRVCANP